MKTKTNSGPGLPGRLPTHFRKACWTTGLLLGLSASQAFASGGAVLVTDPADLPDPSGDIRSIGAQVVGDHVLLYMTTHGIAAPTIEQTTDGKNNRYYYHWLLDTDNNPATGRSNAEYEGNSTNLQKPIGSERVVMVGWRDGKPNGVEIYDPLDDDTLILGNYPFLASGNTITALVPLSALGLVPGQAFSLAAFQEGASDGWMVDWTESMEMTVESPSGVSIAAVSDPADLGDPSGDIRGIASYVVGDQMVLWMNVHNIAAPSIANTAEGKNNRYYYHWLIDTDNNPATGRSNSEYEGSPTNLQDPIGSERVVMVGWRDGKPNGVEVYNPLDDDTLILGNFPFQAGGNSLVATVPLSALGILRGQTVSVSAFQEGSSDGWAVDWIESRELTLDGLDLPVAAVADPSDLPDPAGDIRGITAHVVGDELHLRMTVHGMAAPSLENTAEGKNNRYYYHWLLDTDNNPATGRSNSEYEGNPTNLQKPIGSERVIMIGWRDGKPNGLEIYDPLDDDTLILGNFPFQASGNTLSAIVPLASIGLVHGQTIAVSAFQEGASDGWMVDWIESQNLTLEPGLGSEAPVSSVDDPSDLPDSSGDIKRIEITVADGQLVLRMSVHGIILPTVEQTPEGKVNRYYYHWLLDTDNNPATGRSNAEYEGNSTNLQRPIGAERVIMVGWRNGAPNGLEVYDPLDDDTALLSDFAYTVTNGVLEVKLPFAPLGITMGQTISFSAFQEGASDGWMVDWVESAEFTVSEGALPGISIPNSFEGDAYGYSIVLTDEGTETATAASVAVKLNGTAATATATKVGGITTITGVHSQLLAPNSTHTLNLNVEVGGENQSRDYVFQVGTYTILPQDTRLATVNTADRGFVVFTTQISEVQTADSAGSVHTNMAALAEKQLTGTMTYEDGTTPYYNEANLDAFELWKGRPHTITGPINWYELAPAESTLLNFSGDEPIPGITGFNANGLVVEIMTYLHLTQGAHKLGLYTEGGHKVTAGLSPSSPVISMIDNSGIVAPVPSYFARNQFFDVVAPTEGYYPLRVLWFQARRSQEPGALFELFSVRNKALHLMNQTGNSSSIMAYRAASLLNPTVPVPELSITRGTDSITVTYTGTLYATDAIGGTWTAVGTPAQSPLTLPTTGTARFLRSGN